MKDPAAAVKLALVAPAAAVTEGGSETLALLEPRAMMAPEAGAGLLKVTRQLEFPLGFKVAGVQLTADTCGSAVNVKEAVAVLPLSEVVICAELSVVNEPAIAVKLAVVAPAAAVTDDGTETLVLLELSVIAVEPLAGLLSVTTHVEVPLGLSVAGVQLNADTCGSAVSVSEAEAVLPLSEAVICAELFVVNEPAVAVKLAVVAPAAAVTDDGTETLVMLELSAIAVEPLAGLLSVTTHAEAPLGLNIVGVQLTADTCGGAVSVSGAEAVLPLSEAMICAELSIVNEPAMAVKAAVVAPAAAVTEAGIETLVLLELSAITVGPLAGLLSVTTHAEVPLGLSVAGLQLNAFTFTVG